MSRGPHKRIASTIGSKINPPKLTKKNNAKRKAGKTIKPKFKVLKIVKDLNEKELNEQVQADLEKLKYWE